MTADRPPLLAAFRATRALTLELCAPLSVEDQGVQAMADVSPPKWHLAHTTWFFEEFVLGRFIAGYTPVDPRFRFLFNSYYEAIGPRVARDRRGLLSRPTVPEVFAYRRRVDEQIEAIVSGPAAEAAAATIELGVHHEQQHQELLLTDVKYNLAQNPLFPTYAARPPDVDGPVAPATWIPFDGGVVHVGWESSAFSFDNERPRHRVFLDPYRLASRRVTNGEWQAFIADGGYRRPELWMADGWAWCQKEGVVAPLYWNGDGVFTLAGPRPIIAAEPVCHVSWYEADAYARWAKKRLATEQEWEHAFADAAVPKDANLLDSGRLHPIASTVDEGPPHGAGDVWEWTASAYAPYPGYVPEPGAIGEYNGKFMCNQFVLRGGSCATPRSHLRPTYRNFFYPHQRWQFTGVRLAEGLT